jgi:hypothetical protein
MSVLILHQMVARMMIHATQFILIAKLVESLDAQILMSQTQLIILVGTMHIMVVKHLWTVLTQA